MGKKSSFDPKNILNGLCMYSSLVQSHMVTSNDVYLLRIDHNFLQYEIHFIYNALNNNYNQGRFVNFERDGTQRS